MGDSRRVFLSLTSAFVTATLFAGASYAGTFSIHFRHLPMIAGTNCDDYAYAEGQKFRDSILPTYPDFSLVDSRCVFENNPGELPSWHVVISYDAAQKLPTVSTLEDAALARPGAATRKACEATLNTQKEIFTRQTKLAVLSAYCSVPMFDKMLWETAIFGVGQSEVRPYNASSNITGTVAGHSAESFIAMIKDGFKKLNAELAEISIERPFNFYTVAMTYYSKERFFFSESDIATFNSKEACLKEVAAATTALTDSHVVNLGVYCSGSFANEIQLSSIVERNSNLNLASSETIYESFEACEAQKAQTVSHYRGSLHRDIKVGFCTAIHDPLVLNKSRFQVVMIEKR